jgi:ABC-type iron transport system FetAB permease component
MSPEVVMVIPLDSPGSLPMRLANLCIGRLPQGEYFMVVLIDGQGLTARYVMPLDVMLTNNRRSTVSQVLDHHPKSVPLDTRP